MPRLLLPASPSCRRLFTDTEEPELAYEAQRAQSAGDVGVEYPLATAMSPYGSVHSSMHGSVHGSVISSMLDSVHPEAMVAVESDHRVAAAAAANANGRVRHAYQLMLQV